MWSGLGLLSAVRGLAGPLCFPALLLILNSAISARYGFWNGLASSVAACARAVSPSLFGHLFAVGSRAGHAAFPFDASMPFLLASASLAGATALVFSAGRAERASSAAPRRRNGSLRRLCVAVASRVWAPASRRSRAAPIKPAAGVQLPRFRQSTDEPL